MNCPTAVLSFPDWALTIPEVRNCFEDIYGSLEEDDSFWAWDNDQDIIVNEHDGVISIEQSDLACLCLPNFNSERKVLRNNFVPYDVWNDSFHAVHEDGPEQTFCYRPEVGKEILLKGNSFEVNISSLDIEKILNKPNLKAHLQKLLPPKIKELCDYKKPVKIKNNIKSSCRR